jgi:hypothetical protein
MRERSVRLNLEQLEDRTTPNAMTFTGAMPSNGHPGGDGTTWGQVNNWDIAKVPGNGDDVTIPTIYTGTITGNPNVALNSLKFLQGTGTLRLDNPLTVAGGGLTMHGGTISASSTANNLTLQGGASIWDGGTIGAGWMLSLKMNSAATLDVFGTVTLDCGLYVGASSTSTGVCNLWGATVDTTAASVTFRISAGGLLSLNARPNVSPPVGSSITGDPSRPGYVDDQGTVVATAGAGPAGTQTAHSIQPPILVSNGGVLSVQANTMLNVRGNASQPNAVEADGGKVNLGQSPGGANPDGNAQLNCTVFGSKIDSASFLAVYGTQNTWSDPAGLGLRVDGTLRLALQNDTSWEQSTLEVTNGSLTFGGNSTLTLFGWHSDAVVGTHCLYDWIHVDAGNISLLTGWTLNPFWTGKDASDLWGDPATFSGFLTVASGSTLTLGTPTIFQNQPPGYPPGGVAGTWAVVWDNPPAFTSLALTWAQ